MQGASGVSCVRLDKSTSLIAWIAIRDQDACWLTIPWFLREWDAAAKRASKQVGEKRTSKVIALACNAKGSGIPKPHKSGLCLGFRV